MKIKSALLSLPVIASLCFASFATAQTTTKKRATTEAAPSSEPASIGTFGRWEAFSYTQDKAKTCYIYSAPIKSMPEKLNRDSAYFLVSHFAGKKIFGQVSIIIGYEFKSDSRPSLVIGEKKFELIPKGNMAYAISANADLEITAAMKKGKEMLVSGISKRGTETTDTFSLKQVTAALAKLDEACK